MSARVKIHKPQGVQPDELELHVAQAIYDLEHNVADLSADLAPLQIAAAKEVWVITIID
jgi:small subunit ribosomal protein S7e